MFFWDEWSEMGLSSTASLPSFKSTGGGGLVGLRTGPVRFGWVAAGNSGLSVLGGYNNTPV